MIYDLKLSSVIKSGEGSFSLLDYLTTKFTYKKAEDWLNCILKGMVYVNGNKINNNCFVYEGDKIEFIIQDFYEPDLNCNFKIEHEDENIIVVSKPSDLPVQATRRIFRQTLTELVRKQFKNDKLNPIHRLDRETSGLIIYLKKNYENGSLRKNPLNIIKAKYYLTVLKGNIQKDIVEVNVPLKEANDGIINYKMIPSEKGLDAKTVFYKIAEEKNLTVALVRIFTGRKHQIRAHAAYLGCPVLGDKIYCDNGKYFLLRSQDKLDNKDLIELGANKQMLHAYSLILNLPDIGEKQIISSLMTEEMTDIIKKMCSFEKINEKIDKYYK